MSEDYLKKIGTPQPENLNIEQKRISVATLGEIKSFLEQAREDLKVSDAKSMLDSKAKKAFFMIGQRLSVRMEALNTALKTFPQSTEDLERYQGIFRQIAGSVIPMHLRYEILGVENDVVENKEGAFDYPLPVALSHHMKHFLGIYDGEENDFSMLEDGLRDQLLELCGSLYHWDPKYEIGYLKRSKTNKFIKKIDELEKLEPLSQESPSRSSPIAEAFNQYVESQWGVFKDYVNQASDIKNLQQKVDDLLLDVTRLISELEGV